MTRSRGILFAASIVLSSYAATGQSPPPPSPPPLQFWSSQVYETVTAVNISISQWNDDFSAAYETAYSNTYPYINQYLVSTYLATPTTVSPAGYTCTPSTCTDINTLFYFADTADTNAAETMLNVTNKVVTATLGDPALWASLTSVGLTSPAGEGAIAFVRRGWTPFTRFDLTSTE